MSIMISLFQSLDRFIKFFHGKYTLEKLESKMKKYKGRLNEIDAELARMNLASKCALHTNEYLVVWIL